MCHFRCGRILVLFALALACSRALGQSWNNPAGGSYDTAGNWNPPAIPGSGATIDFSLNNTYTVVLPTSRAVTNVNFNLGTVTLVSGGTTTTSLVPSNNLNVGTGLLTLSDLNLVVGNLASINSGGRMRINSGKLTADSLRVGTSGGDGSLTVTGASSGLVLIGTTSSLIGQSGNAATLTINGSATATIGGTLNLAVSGVANSTGLVSIGTNSVVTAATINAGTGGLTGQAATITLSNGARLTQTGASALTLGAASNSSAFLSIGDNCTFSTGTGPITVNNTASILVTGGRIDFNGVLNINGGLLRLDDTSFSTPDINFLTGSTVTVQNGGVIDRVSSAITGAISNPTNGTLLITGAGSAARNVPVSVGSNGTVIVSAGANIDNAAGVSGMPINPGGTLILDGGSVTNTGINIGGGTASSSVIVRNNGSISSPNDSISLFATGTGATRTLNIDTGGRVTLFGLSVALNGLGSGTNSSDIVNVGATSTLSLNGGTGAATRLFLGGSNNVGTINIASGGTFVTGAGTVNINPNGWLNLAGRWISTTTDLIHVSGGTITQTAGTWTLPSGGAITVDNGGAIDTIGNIIPNGGTLTVTGPGSVVDCGPGTALANGGALASIVSGGSFSANLLNVGVSTDGTVVVDGAGSAMNITTGTGLGSIGGDGTIIVSNGGRATVGNVSVAGTGSSSLGRISVISGGSLSIGGNLFIGTDAANSTSGGTVLVSDPGSIITQTGSGTVSVGLAFGAPGALIVDNSGRFNSGTGTVLVSNTGRIDVKSGRFIMNGNTNVNGGQINVGGPFSVTQPTARFELTPGHTLTINTGTVNLQENGVLSVNGGRILTHNAGLNFAGGSLDFNAGTIVISSSAFSPDALTIANLLGPQATLFPGHTLITQTLTLSSTLMLDGGTLTVGTLSSGTGASLLLRSGQFNLNLSPLIVGGTGAFAQLDVPAGLTFNATGPAGTVNAGGGGIKVDGGTLLLSSGLTIASGAQVRLGPSAGRVLATTGSILNNGLLVGSGRVEGSVLNQPGGIIRVNDGDQLTIAAGTTTTNSGTIQLLGGALEFSQALTNNTGATISGHGSLFTAGLTNNGSITLVGPDASIFGATTNSATARVLVTSGTSATFFDPLTNQAGSIFKVSDASVAAFLSPVTGLAAFTGNGTTIFESTASGGALAAGTTVVDGTNGSLTATSIRQPSLIVRGQAAIAPNGTSAATSRLSALTIDLGTVDLNDNDLVIDYSGANPFNTVRSYLASGALRSSLADATHRLGYADNATLGLATFSGQVVDATSILVKYTFAGDANLDGQVDVTDLGALATNWQTSAAWTGGDFNYDGFVDVTDLDALATNWQAGVGSPLAPSRLNEALAAVGLNTTEVPEPALAGVGLAAALLLLVLRRTRTAGVLRAVTSCCTFRE